MNDFAGKRLAKPSRFANISLGILNLILPLLVGHESGLPAASVDAFAQGTQDCEPLIATDIPAASESFLLPFYSSLWGLSMPYGATASSAGMGCGISLLSAPWLGQLLRCENTK